MRCLIRGEKTVELELVGLVCKYKDVWMDFL